MEQHEAQRRITTTLFLDVKGAHDNVTQEAVLNALDELGIGGRLYAWIESYLTNIYLQINR